MSKNAAGSGIRIIFRSGDWHATAKSCNGVGIRIGIKRVPLESCALKRLCLLPFLNLEGGRAVDPALRLGLRCSTSDRPGR